MGPPIVFMRWTMLALRVAATILGFANAAGLLYFIVMSGLLDVLETAIVTLALLSFGLLPRRELRSLWWLFSLLAVSALLVLARQLSWEFSSVNRPDATAIAGIVLVGTIYVAMLFEGVLVRVRSSQHA